MSSKDEEAIAGIPSSSRQPDPEISAPTIPKERPKGQMITGKAHLFDEHGKPTALARLPKPRKLEDMATADQSKAQSKQVMISKKAEISRKLEHIATPAVPYLELLPIEIISKIIDQLLIDLYPNIIPNQIIWECEPEDRKSYTYAWTDSVDDEREFAIPAMAISHISRAWRDEFMHVLRTTISRYGRKEDVGVYILWPDGEAGAVETLKSDSDSDSDDSD